MFLKMKSRIGKRGQIYLPKKVLKSLNLKEGDLIELQVKDNTITIIPIPDPLELALYGDKWATITLDEAEKISETEQKHYERLSSTA